MKTLLMLFAAFAITAAVHAAETVKLPEPQKSGGPDLLTAIDRRASAGQGDFPKNRLSAQDLSTLLWAASGHNRDGAKWTVPMGMGRPPYTKIYVTDKDGVYLYNWKDHTLEVIGRDAVHGEIPMQAFGKSASTNLYMVTDGAALENEEWGVLLGGNMSQNVYLASQAIDVGVRLVYSIDREKCRTAFKLDSRDKVIFAIIMGKK